MNEHATNSLPPAPAPSAFLPSGNAAYFEAWLRKACQTADGPYLRPFAPNPYWKSARVFVVGTNPATPLRKEFASFEKYWEALTLDKAAFEAVYLSKREGKASKTSIRAARFEQALDPLPVLRTNACALPSIRWGDLPTSTQHRYLAQGKDVLHALVEICRPSAIVCHGKAATDVISSLFSVPLDPYAPLTEQNHVGRLSGLSLETKLFAYPHFSGIGVRKGFSVSAMDEELASLARHLVQQLG